MFAASEHIRLVVREALAPAATAIHVHRVGDHPRAGIGTHGSSLLRVGSPVVKLAARGQTYRPARDGLGVIAVAVITSVSCCPSPRIPAVETQQAIRPHVPLIPKRYLTGHEEVLDGIGMPTHANSIAIGPAAAEQGGGTTVRKFSHGALGCGRPGLDGAISDYELGRAEHKGQ